MYCSKCGNMINSETGICQCCGFHQENLKSNSNLYEHQQSQNSNYFVNMLQHVLLLLFTFGIYHCIWIYKTTEYTNQLNPNEERNAIGNLLLCMFIPFYIVFWYYKTADIMFNYFGDINSDFKTLSLVFSIFAPFISAILIQDKINNTYPNNFQANKNPINNQENNQVNQNCENIVIDEIKKYKELLDMGIITQEEFDIKKKEILKF